MKRLKKCPCCGGDPRCMKYVAGSEEHPFTYFTDRYAIQCEYTGEEKGCGMESGHYKSIDEAADAWNRRQLFPKLTYFFKRIIISL